MHVTQFSFVAPRLKSSISQSQLRGRAGREPLTGNTVQVPVRGTYGTYMNECTRMGIFFLIPALLLFTMAAKVAQIALHGTALWICIDAFSKLHTVSDISGVDIEDEYGGARVANRSCPCSPCS